MNFDLLSCAKAHGHRVRNLHDAYPVPPMLPTGPRRSRGYCGKDDREDAIICKHGYVVDDHELSWTPAHRLGWCLLTKSSKAKTYKLRRLAVAGATVIQEGDTEAVGSAPLERLDDILRTLQPYRKRTRPELAGIKPGSQKRK
jgi:hypothetical protein